MAENEAMAGTTSRHEQAERLREHYESVSIRASDWFNQIPIAIDLWERWPELEAAIARLQEQLEAGERNLDTEQVYTADLEATLACDYCRSPLDHARHLSLDVEEAQRERDEARALAERRKAALVALMPLHVSHQTDRWAADFERARTAIEEEGKR